MLEPAYPKILQALRVNRFFCLAVLLLLDLRPPFFVTEALVNRPFSSREWGIFITAKPFKFSVLSTAHVHNLGAHAYRKFNGQYFGDLS